jgi:ankyrin repeat protein
VDVNYSRGRSHHRTPLQNAVYGHHSEMVQILLEAGADPNAWDKNYPDEGPPLAIANEKGYTDIASLLIHHGADLDVQLG